MTPITQFLVCSGISVAIPRWPVLANKSGPVREQILLTVRDGAHIQFFAPGVPQVYYIGLLAGTNDLDLLRRTRAGRDIRPTSISSSVWRAT
jgi:hypothetical protein